MTAGKGRLAEWNDVDIRMKGIAAPGHWEGDGVRCCCCCGYRYRHRYRTGIQVYGMSVFESRVWYFLLIASICIYLIDCAGISTFSLK